MPEIFEENSKLRIVEYGKSETVSEIMSDVRDGIMNLLTK